MSSKPGLSITGRLRLGAPKGAKQESLCACVGSFHFLNNAGCNVHPNFVGHHKYQDAYFILWNYRDDIVRSLAFNILHESPRPRRIASAEISDGGLFCGLLSNV